MTASILGASQGSPPDALGDREILELPLTDGRRPMAECWYFRGEAITVWTLGKMNSRKERPEGNWCFTCSKAWLFCYSRRLFFKKQKYNNPNTTTTSMLWLTWSVSAVFPWIPLSFPSFIPFLHTVSSVPPKACAHVSFSVLPLACWSPRVLSHAVRCRLPLGCVHIVSKAP